MNEKKLKKLYTAHAESSAPDMDALWKRIESGLEEKDETRVTSKPVKRKISMGRLSLAGAVCAALLIILPVAVRNGSSSDMETAETAGAPNGVYDAEQTRFEYEAEDTEAVFTTTAAMQVQEEEAAEETEAALGEPVLYENLDLAPAASAGIAPQGETDGDDYFVEADVLIQTDVIVNAYVDKVYSRGGTVCYELTAENAESGDTKSITLESATPYVLLESRSYVLPLKSRGDGYSLAFENAPQIEVTLDGGLIFHNGWECLSDGNEADVIYPQGSVDDFFYDRMKFSYTADVQTLVKKWREINGDDKQ